MYIFKFNDSFEFINQLVKRYTKYEQTKWKELRFNDDKTVLSKKKKKKERYFHLGPQKN